MSHPYSPATDATPRDSDLDPHAGCRERAAALRRALAAADEIGRCEDCRWWDNSTSLITDTNDQTGACRKLPPVADDRSGAARWPYTNFDDWCAGFAVVRGGRRTRRITAPIAPSPPTRRPARR